MTLTRLLPFAMIAILGCRTAADAPLADSIRWPDMFAYRVDYVAELQRDRVPLGKLAESKTVRFNRRDSLYLAVYDSVLKTSQQPGGRLMQLAFLPIDTLIFYVKLGARGEISSLALGCDQALAACAEATPSILLLELRRVVPRLAATDSVPAGGWVDTMAFDDAGRPGGTRGTVITSYLGRRDTVIAGRQYWMIGWRSVRRSFEAEGGEGPLGATRPVEEEGITLIDRSLLLPVLSTWAGATTSAPSGSARPTSTGYRGRAYLAGSHFDSLYSRDLVP